MQKRPLSMTIIGWFLIVFSLFGLYGILTMGSNPVAMKMLEQAHISLLFQQVWGVINCIVTLICAYGILKGQPWSRVLYVGWGIVGIVVGFHLADEGGDRAQCHLPGGDWWLLVQLARQRMVRGARSGAEPRAWLIRRSESRCGKPLNPEPAMLSETLTMA
jgi:hypothetical protein